MKNKISTNDDFEDESAISKSSIVIPNTETEIDNSIIDLSVARTPLENIIPESVPLDNNIYSLEPDFKLG